MADRYLLTLLIYVTTCWPFGTEGADTTLTPEECCWHCRAMVQCPCLPRGGAGLSPPLTSSGVLCALSLPDMLQLLCLKVAIPLLHPALAWSGALGPVVLDGEGMDTPNCPCTVAELSLCDQGSPNGHPTAHPRSYPTTSHPMVTQ